MFISILRKGFYNKLKTTPCMLLFRIAFRCKNSEVTPTDFSNSRIQKVKNYKFLTRSTEQGGLPKSFYLICLLVGKFNCEPETSGKNTLKQKTLSHFRPKLRLALPKTETVGDLPSPRRNFDKLIFY